MGLQKNIDRHKIGICGFGGFALNATAIHKRVKAVATTSLYDITRVTSKGYNDAMTPEQGTETLEDIILQLWKDAEKRSPAEGQEIYPKY